MTSHELETIKSIPLFSAMDEQELTVLRTNFTRHHFVPGQIIIREGEAGYHFYIILTGEVQYVTNDASGGELIVDEESAGGFFGELSMITGEPRAMRVRAKNHVEALGLTREQFHAFLLSHPHAGIDVLTVLGRRLYHADRMIRQSVIRNLNQVAAERITLGQRIADSFAATMGSWPFIIVQSVILVIWVALNVLGWVHSWDPYPFILLNLALSFQAAYAAPIIMMSQNRQADKDRLAAEIDHEVNVRAEIKAGLLMQRLDDIEKEMHELHRVQIEHIQAHQAPPQSD